MKFNLSLVSGKCWACRLGATPWVEPEHGGGLYNHINGTQSFGLLEVGTLTNCYFGSIDFVTKNVSGLQSRL